MRILRKHRAELVRYSTHGSYDEDGNFFSGTSEDADDIPCCIQPDYTRIKQYDLPEGIRIKDCRIVWTEVLLQGADEKTNTQADILRFEGYEYDVYEIAPWDGAGRIKAWEVLAVRRDTV